jgi:hypothetical protein
MINVFSRFQADVPLDVAADECRANGGVDCMVSVLGQNALPDKNCAARNYS